jgi:hypothetical protein
VLGKHSLGTGGYVLVPYFSFAGQPVLGGQFGTGIACETTKPWLAELEDVGLVVTALATKPAKTMEKMEAWTASFMICVTSGYFIFSVSRSAEQLRV